MLNFTKLLFISFIAICLSFTSGCATIKNYQLEQQQKKEDALVKKNQFMALKGDIENNILRNGTLADNLKTKYGPPDDVFYSSSGISSFQIWTYNIGKDKLSDTTPPILLYLENEKLVNCKY